MIVLQVSWQGDHRGGAEPGEDGAAGGVGDGQAQPQDGQEEPESGESEQIRLHHQEQYCQELNLN